MLTGDGRILIIAIQVKVKQQDNDFEDVEEEDDVFLSDEEQGELRVEKIAMIFERLTRIMTL